MVSLTRLQLRVGMDGIAAKCTEPSATLPRPENSMFAFDAQL
jgi:hypothetical protein